MCENIVGRGQPHPVNLVKEHLRKQSKETPPAMYTVNKIQECFLYLVSLEFLLGNLDTLEKKASSGKQR